ncbi:ATP synthase subunit C [Ructibacterium gallinarum]
MLKSIALFVMITLAISIPLVAHFGLKLQGGKMKTAIGVNLLSFFGLMLTFGICMIAGATDAFAAGTDAAASSASSMKYLGAALSTGLACIGSGIAVASSASAALGAISEDPKIMGKSLIFVALAEGIALYGLLISFLILFQ